MAQKTTKTAKTLDMQRCEGLSPKALGSINKLGRPNDSYTEKKLNKFFNKNGMFFCENGYIDYKLPKNKNILIEGYFQSEKYFPNTKDLLKKYFSISRYLFSASFSLSNILSPPELQPLY